MSIRNWTRDETILALYLYFCVPISKTNPRVIEIANLIGRTADAVSLKMSNLAYHDPEGPSGMPHGSSLDEAIFNEFKGNWETLAYQASKIKAELLGKPPEELINKENKDIELPPGLYKGQEVRVRVGQGFFRDAVLNAYGSKCCITGLAQTELLIASHIKPWKDSNEENERTNPKNGLCLNALHDKAFDKGFITVTTDYKIVVSKALQKVAMDDGLREWFMGYDGGKISEPEKFQPGKEFLKYHNEKVFRG